MNAILKGSVGPNEHLTKPSIERLETMSSDDNNNSKSANISHLRLQLSPFRVWAEVCPSLADIIEIDRTIYTHWAIYVGNGYVVDVVAEDDNDLPLIDEAVVRKVLLAQVVGDSFCRINNKEVPAKERNLSPKHPEFVVKKVIQKVGSNVEYNLLTRNCEHYLTQWKYGQPWSDQAAVALSSIQALRREHKDSTSDGHSFLVNTLNEVLNSPGASASTSPSSPNLLRANSFSRAVQTETTSVI